MAKNCKVYQRFWSLLWGHIMNWHQSNALDTASILVSNLWFSLTLRDYAQSGSQCLNITLPDQVKHPPEQAFWNIHCCSVLLWCFMAAFGCCGGLDSESSTAFSGARRHSVWLTNEDGHPGPLVSWVALAPHHGPIFETTTGKNLGGSVLNLR